MTCEEHDRQAASTQFVTHTVGRMLGAMELASTEINTRGYEALLQLVNNTNHDSFDLYYGLFLYNNNATGARSDHPGHSSSEWEWPNFAGGISHVLPRVASRCLLREDRTVAQS